MNIIPHSLHTTLGKIKKVPSVLASRAFLIIMSLILITLLLGGFLFYQYIVLTVSTEQDGVEKNSMFSYTGYTEILKTWKTRQESIEATKNKVYTNPFTAQNQKEIIKTDDQ